MKSALPVFSVNTVEEARELFTHFGKLAYDGRYYWTDFIPGDLDQLDQITDQIADYYKKHYESNPRGMEEEWLEGEEGTGEVRSPWEGDIPPWGQAGHAEFPMATRVVYVNGYTLVQATPQFRMMDNLKRYGSYTRVGEVKGGVELGTYNFYVPFASIPVRKEDEDNKDRFMGYLRWLAKSIGLVITHIMGDDNFPEGKFDPKTGRTSGEVVLPNKRWFPVEFAPAFRHPALQYVNAFVQNSYYGGSEEGGWWYDAGEPIASVPFKSGYSVTQKKMEEYLRVTIGWHSKYPLSSVLGHDVFGMWTEDSFAQPYPEETPHYE